MKVSVDKEPCIGCGRCGELYFAVFEMDDTSSARVIIPYLRTERIPAEKQR